MKIPYSKPGTSKSNKTGSWRTSKPELSQEKCIKCGICEQYCPDSAINRPDGFPEFEMDFCKGCGICASMCPHNAIEMKKDNHEK